MVNAIRNFIIMVDFRGWRQQIKTCRDKAVSIWPVRRKQGKTFLKFMFHMDINACQQLHFFTAVTLDYGIIQDQDIPFLDEWACQKQRLLLPQEASENSFSYRIFHSENDSMCFRNRPVLCVWNSETGRGFYPEILTIIKTGILYRQKHRRIS